jgi:hypothetical protein
VSAEDDHFVHLGPLGVDGGVGLTNPVPRSAIFMMATPLMSRESRAAADAQPR